MFDIVKSWIGDLFFHENGNFVIQKCLEIYKEEDFCFLLQQIIVHVIIAYFSFNSPDSCSSLSSANINTGVSSSRNWAKYTRTKIRHSSPRFFHWNLRLGKNLVDRLMRCFSKFFRSPMTSARRSTPITSSNIFWRRDTMITKKSCSTTTSNQILCNWVAINSQGFTTFCFFASFN